MMSFYFTENLLCFRVRVRVKVRVRFRVRVEVRFRVRVRLGLEVAEILLNAFSVKRPFNQVYYSRSANDACLSAHE